MAKLFLVCIFLITEITWLVCFQTDYLHYNRKNALNQAYLLISFLKNQLKGDFFMSNLSEFYTLDEVYGEKFYQLPKVFFTNPKYKTLSCSAKMVWSILKDRHSASVKNRWVDSQNRVYLIYKNQSLVELTNINKNKITKVMKELEEANLIMRKKRHLGRVDVIYLKRPELTEADMYEIDKLETGHSPDPHIENEKTPSEDVDYRADNIVEANAGAESTKRGFKRPQNEDSGIHDIGIQESYTVGRSNTNSSNTNSSNTNDKSDISDRSDILNSHRDHQHHSNQPNESVDYDSVDYEKRYLVDGLPNMFKNLLIKFKTDEIQEIKRILFITFRHVKRDFEAVGVNTKDTHLDDIDLYVFEGLSKVRQKQKQVYAKYNRRESIFELAGYINTTFKNAIAQYFSLHSHVEGKYENSTQTFMYSEKH